MNDASYSLVIEARGGQSYYWRDLWRYREVLFNLCRRDLAVRYRQTVVGVAWALLRPLTNIIAFTVLLGNVAKLPSEPGTPYPILVFTGTMAWTFFSQCLTSTSGSLLANANLVSKVYLPRLLIPTSTIAVALVDFAVMFALFCLVMFWFAVAPPIQCLLLPAFVFLSGLLALGPGLMLAAWTVKYRDITHVTPLITQCGMYLSPVVYVSSLVPDRWQWLYQLNPMVGVIDGIRWCLLGTPEFPGKALLFSFVWAIVLLAGGIHVFRNMERTFVDVL